MFLVLKRFPMDDVPLCLVKTKRTAKRRIEKDKKEGSEYATDEQEKLMKLNIGLECCAYMIVTFNLKGQPTNSEIWNYELRRTYETNEQGRS